MYEELDIERDKRADDAKIMADSLWRNSYKENHDEKRYYEEYLDGLFPLELKYILRYVKKPEPFDGTLVFLIGHNLEPLFFSLCIWQPKNVILVCNKKYFNCEGPEQYSFVRQMIMNLKSGLADMFNEQEDGDIAIDLKFSMPDSIKYEDCLSDDTPAAVFAYMQKNCRDQKVIIDITGGKKSMISGAFLYAAYSDNDIAYVDFDKYHPRFQRPYGITSKPQKMPNPYQIFALRNWEEIRKSYEKYTFDTAISILEEIIAVVDNTAFYNGEQVGSMKSLLTVLYVYKHWNDTNYEQAKIVFGKLNEERQEKLREGIGEFECPSILEEFAGWDLKRGFDELAEYLTGDSKVQETQTEINSTGNSLDKQLFTNPKALSLFIRDELYKAERLLEIHHDYRASFVRSASISEVLVKARIWLIRGRLPIVEEKDKNENGIPSKHTIEDYLIKGDLSSFLNLLKEHKKPVRFRIEDYTTFIDFDDPDENLARFRGVENRETLNKIEKLASARNKTVHGCFPISKKLAQAALEVAKSNMEEFILWLDEETRKSAIKGNYQIMEWRKLKKILALDFIPGGDDQK